MTTRMIVWTDCHIEATHWLWTTGDELAPYNAFYSHYEMGISWMDLMDENLGKFLRKG